jgi:hypothetical protein
VIRGNWIPLGAIFLLPVRRVNPSGGFEHAPIVPTGAGRNTT